MAYDLKEIARELTDTALGNRYCGNALYVAQDIPVLKEEERLVIKRWLGGAQTTSDGWALQEIANKLAVYVPQ